VAAQEDQSIPAAAAGSTEGFFFSSLAGLLGSLLNELRLLLSKRDGRLALVLSDRSASVLGVVHRRP
jgi:hypothetical protein